MTIALDGRVVIVGAGVVATAAIDTLRLAGHTGPITVLGDETHAPYARPPLSKAVLSGAEDASSTLLSYSDTGVRFAGGVRATGLDVRRRVVLTEAGERVPFDGLLIATGARARRLTSDPDELVLRTLDDVSVLRSRLAVARTVLVVGSGFLALEIASGACAAGVAVVLAIRPESLRRRLGELLADALISAAHGAGVTVVPPEEAEQVAADVRVTAIGCEANTEWLADALPAAGGLHTDEHGRIGDAMVAAGDVAVFPDGTDAPTRTPTWTAAIAQARTAALALIRDDGAPYRADPYLWTDAFGLSCKLAGQWPPVGSLDVVDGDWATGSVVLAGPGSAAAVNTRTPIARLRAIAAARLS